jgi:hypothetical protein
MKTNATWPLICLLLLSILENRLASAFEGEPVAVRRWPGGSISVETHWGFILSIPQNDTNPNGVEGNVDKELILNESYNHVLARIPNQDTATWESSTPSQTLDPNSVQVTSIRANESTFGLQLTVDGVRIAIVAAEHIADHGAALPATDISYDLLVLNFAEPSVLSSQPLQQQISGVSVHNVMLNCQTNLSANAAERFATSIGASTSVKATSHNTLALAAKPDDADQTSVVVLSDTPWKMPTELAGLFEAMEKANRASREVFAKLSAQQLNFRPANGTHTPRWNCEHMMGRQLLFFSQIYNAIDPTIPILNLNPKQMPPDYQAAHPDWDGAEEARQTERVGAFTRRFANLLEGVDLEKRAPGSGWTLRRLLNQMDVHYAEHTANTVKKFDLPEWPKN